MLTSGYVVYTPVFQFSLIKFNLFIWKGTMYMFSFHALYWIKPKFNFHL